MEVLEQSPKLVVCHQSATYMRGFGLLFTGLGAGALVLVTHVDASHVHGSPWVAYVVGVAFVIVGLVVFCLAEDDRIVLDGAAHVARIIRRGLWRQSTTEVPFAKIQDVALEVTTSTMSNNGGSRMTWRPVFVCENNSRVPWTPMSTSDRASQARAVAAARAMGGWNALPVEGSPALARAATALKNIGCLYAFCAVFFGMLLLMMGVQVAPLATWVPTPATVVSTGIEEVRGSNNGASYAPMVTYRYTVGGTQYVSGRVSALKESASRQWAQSVIDRYPTGASVTAWYDPKHPGNAIVDHHLARIPLIMMGIGLAVVLLIVWAAKRGQSMTQAALAGADVPVVPAMGLSA
jgi:hypothetical protein